MAEPICVPLGDDALRVDLPGPSSAAWRRAAVEALAALPGVADAWSGETSLALRWAGAPRPAAEVQAALAGVQAGSGPPAVTHRLAVCFDGPDLPAVAEAWGCGPEAVAALFTAAPLTVMAIGFQPGFAYLGPLPGGRSAPRRPQPRPRVPAGAFGLGGDRAGVYPGDCPGGWQLIGRAAPGALSSVAVGDAVWIEPRDIP